MTLQYSTALNNGRLQSDEDIVGVSPTLEIRTGPPPANVAAAATGSVLVSIALPSDWQAAASGGAAAKSGTWSATASGTGRSGHFLIKASGGTRHIQGIAAGPWKASTNYAVGDTVTNDSGKVFRATTAGVSASAGGPTGTGSGITDGAAVWGYVQAAADMSLDSGEIASGQTLTVSSFTRTASNV